MVDPSMRERMLAGEPYVTDEEILAWQAERQRVLDAYNAARDPVDVRRRLVELCGTVGADTFLRPPVYVDYGSHLHLGDRVFANFGLVALDVAPVTIGDDVQIGPNVQLLTPTHPLDPEERRAKWEGSRPIRIGSNVWIGAGAMVLAGVTIGDDTVVGAGAVVTRDLPPRVLAVGNPARVVRDL